MNSQYNLDKKDMSMSDYEPSSAMSMNSDRSKQSRAFAALTRQLKRSRHSRAFRRIMRKLKNQKRLSRSIENTQEQRPALEDTPPFQIPRKALQQQQEQPALLASTTQPQSRLPRSRLSTLHLLGSVDHAWKGGPQPQVSHPIPPGP